MIPLILQFLRTSKISTTLQSLKLCSDVHLTIAAFLVDAVLCSVQNALSCFVITVSLEFLALN